MILSGEQVSARETSEMGLGRHRRVLREAAAPLDGTVGRVVDP
jgi:hypothetical protein